MHPAWGLCPCMHFCKTLCRCPQLHSWTPFLLVTRVLCRTLQAASLGRPSLCSCLLCHQQMAVQRLPGSLSQKHFHRRCRLPGSSGQGSAALQAALARLPRPAHPGQSGADPALAGSAEPMPGQTGVRMVSEIRRMIAKKVGWPVMVAPLSATRQHPAIPAGMGTQPRPASILRGAAAAQAPTLAGLPSTFVPSGYQSPGGCSAIHTGLMPLVAVYVYLQCPHL